jgi:CDP-4-dehydro-6-deoxyglucose reductase
MHYHEPWCRALRDSLDNFAFTPLVEAACTDLLALIESDLAEIGNARFYIAGPASAAVAVATALAEAGVAHDRIATETVA